jgi:Oxysterol-binding protein
LGSLMGASVYSPEGGGVPEQAAEQPKGSLERALLVAGFALSHYQSTLRGSKLTIPAMGETFDVVLPEKGVRVLCESVLQDYKDFRCVLPGFLISDTPPT